MTPSSATPAEYFLAAVAAQIREMPVAAAAKYLRGLLSLLPDSAPADTLREIYRHLDTSTAQLDLLISGQLKLDLGGKDGQ